MEKHIEKEYKILVSKTDFYKLLEKYDISFVTQINYYYDTLTMDIIRNRGAMRIRAKNETYLFTLKQPAGDVILEYECYVEDASIHSLNKLEIHNTLTSLGIHPPFQLITTMTTHRAMYICDDYELCFDINEYADITDYEIEYEFKRDHDGYTTFNQILSAINLTYTTNSEPKIKRALAHK